jgi:hypothetical protein
MVPGWFLPIWTHVGIISFQAKPADDEPVKFLQKEDPKRQNKGIAPWL